jgi:hypothetical protein
MNCHALTLPMDGLEGTLPQTLGNFVSLQIFTSPPCKQTLERTFSIDSIEF